MVLTTYFLKKFNTGIYTIMNKLSSYELTEKLNESPGAFIYRAQKKENGETCVLKILKSKHPSPSDIARFRHEYDIIRDLNIDGIIKTREIIIEPDTIAIELENFYGSRLKDMINTPWLTIEKLLETAVKIVDILATLHQSGITHKDIKPQNILIKPESGEVKITDFGISSMITREQEELYNPGVIEGTLFYMSPEQTGRMNRSVDYRTDIYSTGITLYEMATGSPPFVSDDPMEVFHSHIARNPKPPSAINPDIPAVLSDVILRCLAKTAEYRYQSALGLSSDLKKCLEHFKNGESIPLFETGLNDISDRFNIPQKLYGREKETAVLLSSFDRVSSGGKEITLVSGAPGIGKSALIQEVQKPIVEKRGYYIFGKYDQFKRDVPYSAFIQAFQNLIKQILTESEEKIDLWKNNLLRALGSNGRIITEAIPAVEIITGEQPILHDLGSEESQNRFALVFKNFISVFAKREHPLVLFLDDLQWADSASINLLEKIILDKEIQSLYIIGAYRENEIGLSHPLNRIINTAQDAEQTTNTIALGPVNLEQLQKLIAETLKVNIKTTVPLAELIYNKTGGNPFFFIQFMKSLYDGRMLAFNPDSGWEWDIEKIREMQVTENVLELMSDKISALKPEAIEILKVCACIGNRFDLETLSIVYEKPVEDILMDLSDPLYEGMIFFSGDTCRFLHDRIHEAAYSLIPSGTRPVLHYRIGTHVLNNTPEEDLKDKIFYIVNHLNVASNIIESNEEKKLLLELNRTAGKKAKNSAAYEAASKYFETALSLLPENQWEADYENSFNLSMNLAECEHINRNFRRAEQLFDEMNTNARDSLDKARICNLKVMMIASLGRHEEAVRLGIEGLGNFGIKISNNPGKITIAAKALKIKFLLSRHKIESIEDLPVVSDEKTLLLMNYLMSLVTTSYYYKTDLVILLAMKMFELTLKKGLSRYSAYACVVYGSVAGGGLGDYETGYRLGRLALRLNKKFKNAELNSKLSLLFGSLIAVWKEPLDQSIDYIKEAINYSIENGDVNFAIFSMQAIIISMIPRGVNLDLIYREYASHINYIMELQDPGAVNYLISVRQFVQALKGETSALWSMDDKNFSEQTHISNMEKDGIPIILQRHYLIKTRLLYFSEKYREAIITSEKSARLLNYSLGQIVIPEHYLYRALAMAAAAEKMNPVGRVIIRLKLKRILKMFRKWADLNPATFLDKEFLIKAELASLKKDYRKALSIYEEAYSASMNSGFTHCAAIACERASTLCTRLGLKQPSYAYISEAAALYKAWGAAGKIKQMGLAISNENSGLEQTRNLNTYSTSSVTGSGISVSEQLDLSTVMKSSLAISKEIQLEKLLSRMIMILIENAGAEKGVILLKKNESLHIEAVGFSDGSVSVLKSIAVDPDQDKNTSSEAEVLPLSLIHYVYRTGDSVVTADLSGESMFKDDPHVLTGRIKSALCIPVYKSNQLMGLLYLENNLVTGAFTPERVEMMKLLSSQIAISIDNANLYSNMEEMVEDRTARLKQTLDEVQELKEQQDGDYFLTSLLIEPLNVSNVSVPGVNISYTVNSKKKFTFRNRSCELGGDICVAYDLTLRGQKTAVFINSDAMGKSIQGAGGAIVLGSVFKAMVERTNNSTYLQRQSPREWIIEAVKELQSVFESFDCSMMISLVLGIIDTDNSKMYFINAEHPFTVLYRKGRSLFLEKELTVRKIGMPGLTEPEKVYAVQLKPGDVIIAGSDGRDDILIESPGSKTKVINEDETLFLTIVEEADGDLEKIEQKILKNGEQTDDLSLLRIEFT